MTARSPSPFAWRKPIGPTVIAGHFSTFVVLPITFLFLFGVLPPFWGGESRGILAESHYAWKIATDIIHNGINDVTRYVLPSSTVSWGAGDWV